MPSENRWMISLYETMKSAFGDSSRSVPRGSIGGRLATGTARALTRKCRWSLTASKVRKTSITKKSKMELLRMIRYSFEWVVLLRANDFFFLKREHEIRPLVDRNSHHRRRETVFFLLFFFLDMAAVVFCSGSLPGSITTRNRALNVKDRPTRVVDRWRHQTQLNWISVYTLKSFTGYLLPTKFDHGLLGFNGTTRAYRISIIISIVFPIWVGICQFNRSLPGYFFLGYTGVQWFWFSFTGDYEKARWKQWSGWLFKHRLVAAGTTFKRPPPIGQHESHISPCIPPAGVRVFRYALTGFFSDIGVSLTISQWPVMTARSTFDSWRCPWPLSNHFDGGYTSGLVFPKVEKIIRSGGSRSCRVE